MHTSTWPQQCWWCPIELTGHQPIDGQFLDGIRLVEKLNLEQSEWSLVRDRNVDVAIGPNRYSQAIGVVIRRVVRLIGWWLPPVIAGRLQRTEDLGIELSM